MEKEIPSTKTTQNGRKMRKVNTKVASNSPKKKYLSAIFVCMQEL